MGSGRLLANDDTIKGTDAAGEEGMLTLSILRVDS